MKPLICMFNEHSSTLDYLVAFCALHESVCTWVVQRLGGPLKRSSILNRPICAIEGGEYSAFTQCLWIPTLILYCRLTDADNLTQKAEKLLEEFINWDWIHIGVSNHILICHNHAYCLSPKFLEWKLKIHF